MNRRPETSRSLRAFSFSPSPPRSAKMTTVTEVVASSPDRPVVVCDVSPPRGAEPGSLAAVADIDADFLSVAYNPGQSVRVNSVFVAAYIQERVGRPAVFTLATRDMNRIAIQSLLLAADWHGLSNAVIVGGDPIRDLDRGRVTSVSDYTTTSLLSDITRMNRGLDFRGLQLSSATSLCAGATVDLSRGTDGETSLAVRKIEAGAEFLLSQAHFGVGDLVDLQHRASQARNARAPVFAGVQILDRVGIDFGNVPERVRGDLNSGRFGLDIARELASDLWTGGVSTFYVIPTILKGGLRDYEAASDLIEYIRTLPASHPV